MWHLDPRPKLKIMGAKKEAIKKLIPVRVHPQEPVKLLGTVW